MGTLRKCYPEMICLFNRIFDRMDRMNRIFCVRTSLGRGILSCKSCHPVSRASHERCKPSLVAAALAPVLLGAVRVFARPCARRGRYTV